MLQAPKIALILTTIHVPHVLALYRAYGPDVMFFIVGDRKTPDLEVVKFLEDIPNHFYYGVDCKFPQYTCVKLLPENCYTRKNIALLEALRWGADIIVSIDDDNIGMSPAYFHWHEAALTQPFHGLQATGRLWTNSWFDPGGLLTLPAKQRGIPIDVDTGYRVESVTRAKVAVNAGICMGDPDIDAVTRIAMHPEVHGMSRLLSAGVVVNPSTWTVFNSQNVAFTRAIAPALFLPPGTGRYCDIYASLIAQRVMREHNWCVRYGEPAVWQHRNQHDLIDDLRVEIDGMAHVKRIAGFLSNMSLNAASSVVEQTRALYQASPTAAGWLSEQAANAAQAFLDDAEKVL